MNHFLVALGLFAMIPMAGCLDLFGDDAYTPRTVEATLYVTPGTSETVALYQLNDGSQMRAVAITFQADENAPPAVPGPEIRLQEGDTLRLTVINNNPLPHTLHLHGGLIPWEMDGVPYLTQMPIHQGQSFEYVFPDLKAGTYMYHCHVDAAHHIDLGMYGAFIVEERKPKEKYDREFVLMLDEWDNCHVHGNTDPVTGTEQTGEFSNRAGCLERFLQDNLAQNQLVNQPRNAACSIPGLPQSVYDELGCGEHGSVPPQQEPRQWWPETHPVYAPIYNTYLINGKAFPDTLPLVVAEGETIKIRLLHIGEEIHSMHLHGHKMKVTHRDGYRLDSPFYVDTLGILPGERYDVIVEADNPGFWAFHDHVALHVMNDDHDPGGMFTCMAYDGFHGYDADGFETSLGCVDAAMEILGGHHMP